VGLERGPLSLSCLKAKLGTPVSKAEIGAVGDQPRLLVGKPEGRSPLGRPRRRWVDNIKMDLREVRWGDVDWIGLPQDRARWRALVNSVLNLRVP
jgi:hypothetical protein